MTPEKVEALGLATFEDLPASPSASYGKMTPSPSTPVRPTETGPFVFTEVLPLVPAKLANKIRRGEYINMSELLKDNMAVERRWAAPESVSLALLARQLSREKLFFCCQPLHKRPLSFNGNAKQFSLRKV